MRVRAEQSCHPIPGGGYRSGEPLAIPSRCHFSSSIPWDKSLRESYGREEASSSLFHPKGKKKVPQQ